MEGNYAAARARMKKVSHHPETVASFKPAKPTTPLQGTPKPNRRSAPMYPKGMEPVADLANNLPGMAVTARGGVKKNLSNTITLLSDAEQFAGKVAYNELKQRIVTTDVTPMGEPGDLTDARLFRATAWVQACGLDVNEQKLRAALVEIGWRNSFHPVRNYLNGLQWDKKPRLDNWLKTYCNASDLDEYLRLVGPKWMIAAVARVMLPGCQSDSMLILEGDQNQGKSKTFRILGGEWFTDSLTEIRGTDAAAKVCQWWILEMGELHAMSRSETTSMKAFITRREETYRAPWGHVEQTWARTCVFAGTTNPNGGYLKDETGARRFWPVKTEGVHSTDRLEADRDQLWAEAKARFDAGEKWWLTHEQERLIAKPQQDCRYVDDVWLEPVRIHIGDASEASIEEILENALFVPKKEWGHQHRTRVAAILKREGFQNKATWDTTAKKTVKMWVR